MEINYKKNGFLLVKNLFEPFEINSIKEKMRKVFCTFSQKDDSLENLAINLFNSDFEAYIGCCNICQNLIDVYQISIDKRIEEILHKIGLKEICINTKPIVSFSSASTARDENYWKIPAHQDWPSTQGSINGVTCWIPLVNVSNELGPLEVSPRTHLLGFLNCIDNGVPVLEKPNDYDFLPITMNIGDALFFSNFTIHRSGNNTSNSIRLSMHFRYDDFCEETFIKRKYPRHRIDKRKDGILFPEFPSSKELNALFNDN